METKMDQIVVYIETEINPTESEEKVRRAVQNVFGRLDMEIKPAHKGSFLSAVAKGQEALVHMRNLLRRDQIRDAARREMRKGVRDQKVSFYLNKQVAFAGHISFAQETAESPLGPTKVVIESETPKQLVDWLAPRSSKK